MYGDWLDLGGSSGRLVLEFVYHGAQPADGFFEEVIRPMSGAIGTLLEEQGVSGPMLRLITTPDVVATAAGEYETLGLGGERRTGSERVGGVVAGKCLISDDGRRACILVSDHVHQACDGESKLHAINLVAHELGHLHYDAARIAAIGTSPDARFPWEAAGIIAAVAAAEFRADRLADLLTSVALRPTDDVGEPIHPADIIGPYYLDNLPEALDALSPGVEELIWDYRVSGEGMEDMFRRVVAVTEELCIYIAHTEGHYRGPSLAIEGVDHHAAWLLEPIWRPLFDHVRSTAPVPAQNDWADDRAQILSIGREGVTETWRRLGLVATPCGDTFHLAVDSPEG